MKCIYCNNELPEIIEGRRDVCSCENAQKEWSLGIEIQHLKKRLSELNRELNNLDKYALSQRNEKQENKNEN